MISMRQIFIHFPALVFCLQAYGFSFGQATIEVADLTVKVPANSVESVYYGFHEGDKIVINLREVDGKELKEFEVLEYPSSSKFMDYKTVRIENKQISVPQTGIYQFKLSNSHLVSPRICKLTVSRIPGASSPENFNSGVTWETKVDTTWKMYTKDVLVGYDTLYTQKTRKVVASCDTIENFIIEKTEIVHSYLNANGDKSWIWVDLPSNYYTPMETKEVIAWAYWVGVGEESNRAWERNAGVLKTAAKGLASMTLTPLGAFAVGMVAEMVTASSGEDIKYSLMDTDNKNLAVSGLEYRVYDTGLGVVGYKRFVHADLMQGRYWIRLYNDNMVTPVTVTVRATAILRHTLYKMENYAEMTVKPRYENRAFKDPILKSSNQPVLAR